MADCDRQLDRRRPAVSAALDLARRRGRRRPRAVPPAGILETRSWIVCVLADHAEARRLLDERDAAGRARSSCRRSGRAAARRRARRQPVGHVVHLRRRSAAITPRRAVRAAHRRAPMRSVSNSRVPPAARCRLDVRRRACGLDLGHFLRAELATSRLARGLGLRVAVAERHASADRSTTTATTSAAARAARASSDGLSKRGQETAPGERHSRPMARARTARARTQDQRRRSAERDQTSQRQQRHRRRRRRGGRVMAEPRGGPARAPGRPCSCRSAHTSRC